MSRGSDVLCCRDCAHQMMVRHVSIPGKHRAGADCWCNPFIYCPFCEPQMKEMEELDDLDMDGDERI